MLNTLIFYVFSLFILFSSVRFFFLDENLGLSLDRAADMHRENMKKKRRELEQASMDAASDLLDTDSNATFAMVIRSVKLNQYKILLIFKYRSFFSYW